MAENSGHRREDHCTAGLQCYYFVVVIECKEKFETNVVKWRPAVQ